MYSPLLSEGVHTHRHLVKAFEPLNDIPQECTSWRFPNLESLEATFEDEGPGVYDFILGHPTLTCLHFFTRSTEGPGLMFWQTLLGFANLKELSLIEGDTTEKGMAFWEHCTRLECLDTTAQDLERFSGIRPSMVFPKIKELRVKTAGDDDDTYFEMVKRCPSLLAIAWTEWIGERELSRFCQLASQGTRPKLESVSIESSSWVLFDNTNLLLLLGMHEVGCCPQDFEATSLIWAWAHEVTPASPSSSQGTGSLNRQRSNKSNGS